MANGFNVILSNLNFKYDLFKCSDSIYRFDLGVALRLMACAGLSRLAFR